MKKITYLSLALILTGFVSMDSTSQYTYILTIESALDQEKNFNVTIHSELEGASEPEKTVLTDQRTPFEKKLGSGKHVISIHHKGDKGDIKSKVVGIKDGKKMGSAFSDGKSVQLTAGPSGRYTATDQKEER